MRVTTRAITDCAMAALMLLLMADRHTGNPVHECLGLLLPALILAHAWLNRAWFLALGRGAWDAGRLARAALNVLLMAAMAGVLVSAVPISRVVFAPLGIAGSLSLRSLHVCCAHWCLLLAGAHLGLCWGRLMAGVLGRRGVALPRWAAWLTAPLAIAIAARGAVAFETRDVAWLLVMDGAFLPFDETATLAGTVLDYAALGFLCVLGARVLLSGSRRARTLLARAAGGRAKGRERAPSRGHATGGALTSPR